MFDFLHALSVTGRHTLALHGVDVSVPVHGHVLPGVDPKVRALQQELVLGVPKVHDAHDVDLLLGRALLLHLLHSGPQVVLDAGLLVGLVEGADVELHAHVQHGQFLLRNRVVEVLIEPQFLDVGQLLLGHGLEAITAADHVVVLSFFLFDEIADALVQCLVFV